MIRHFVLLTLLIAFCAPLRAGEPPERYPLKPVRVVVGFPPGGPVDLQARVVLQKLSELVRQPVVVDNRPGADSVVGSDLVAKAVPDGYTLLYGNAGGARTRSRSSP